jgi:hypothetical protein
VEVENMIKTEKIVVEDRHLVRTYSDENRYVVRDGVSYIEAIDPVDSDREYVEGDCIVVNEPIDIDIYPVGYGRTEENEAILD